MGPFRIQPAAIGEGRPLAGLPEQQAGARGQACSCGLSRSSGLNSAFARHGESCVGQPQSLVSSCEHWQICSMAVKDVTLLLGTEGCARHCQLHSLGSRQAGATCDRDCRGA